MTDIAVLDAGKTHTRLYVFSGRMRHVCATMETPTSTHEGVPILDVEAIEAWLIEQLKDAGRQFDITAIMPVTHGAAFAVVDEAGNRRAPVIDYEASVPKEISRVYERERPDFGLSGSPNLPLGLNLGRQIAWAEALGWIGASDRLVTYAQYWAARLCGIATSEVSALGCHTDLWNPWSNDWSGLARTRGWADRFAPIRPAGEVLGPISSRVAEATDLAEETAVHCGVHDSNAALIAMEAGLPKAQNRVLISTGTWHILFAPGANRVNLAPERDMLVNVRPDGSPLPSARFMGGREMATVAGGQVGSADLDAVERVLAAGHMAEPSLTETGGPFPDRPGRFPSLPTKDAQALAVIYAVHMWDVMIDLLLPDQGPDQIAIEGSAATETAGQLLATLRPDSEIWIVGPDFSPALGAARLVDPGLITPASAHADRMSALSLPLLGTYHSSWRRRTTGNADMP